MRGGRQLASLVLVAALLLAAAPRPARAHDAPQSAGAARLLSTHPNLGVIGRAPRFTLGDPEGRPVLAAWDEGTKPLPAGEIDHPARLYLIDGAGRVREIYSLSLFDERQAFLDIRALLVQPGP